MAFFGPIASVLSQRFRASGAIAMTLPMVPEAALWLAIVWS